MLEVEVEVEAEVVSFREVEVEVEVEVENMSPRPFFSIGFLLYVQVFTLPMCILLVCVFILFGVILVSLVIGPLVSPGRATGDDDRRLGRGGVRRGARGGARGSDCRGDDDRRGR